MQERKPIDTNQLDFRPYSQLDNYSGLDFSCRDGTDPLGVNSFIHDKPLYLYENNISRIFTVRYQNQIVAFFTLSMSSIGKKEIHTGDGVNIPYPDYPALHLGQLGIESKFQGRGIGQYICKFCRGIGQDTNERIACAFLTIRTTAKLAREYYEPKCKFKWKPKDEGKVWMYYRLFTQKKRYLFETIEIKDELNYKVTTVAEQEAIKNERRCSQCDKKKEIVYQDSKFPNFRLCKECQNEMIDRFRDRP